MTRMSLRWEMNLLVGFWLLRVRNWCLAALCSRFYVVNMANVLEKGIVMQFPEEVKVRAQWTTHG